MQLDLGSDRATINRTAYHHKLRDFPINLAGKDSDAVQRLPGYPGSGFLRLPLTQKGGKLFVPLTIGAPIRGSIRLASAAVERPVVFFEREGVEKDFGFASDCWTLPSFNFSIDSFRSHIL